VGLHVHTNPTPLLPSSKIVRMIFRWISCLWFCSWQVNRVQRTLVEAWGLIRETFVDPTFNHQGTCPIAHTTSSWSCCSSEFVTKYWKGRTTSCEHLEY
jgi:hypothetical protein